MKKVKDLAILFLIYVFAFAVGVVSCYFVRTPILKFFVFDSAATVIVFLFSVIFVNSSVYDPYWSLTPMVMAISLFIRNSAFSPFQLLFLAAFTIWSVRLTANWITVFTDFSYEDWRYRKFRAETSKQLWPIVNFFGIHYVPTVVVFLGMLPIFQIVKTPLGLKSLPGILIVLFGVALEFFADKQMHAFLSLKEEGKVCRRGLWKYSRHPNYLGEMTVWLGVFLTMLPYALKQWYYVIGFLSVVLLFNIVSIPLMEKRQLARRPDYLAYCQTTSRLLLLPVRENNRKERLDRCKTGK